VPLSENEPIIHSTIKVAIAGRPNAGKSALFNALTGQDRAIVSPVAGTTRDTVDSLFDYEGERITFWTRQDCGVAGKLILGSKNIVLLELLVL
tara:strand:+ start:106 stop:384 length:279 start_codon:yes stop_codon:yes gene_type:complete